MSQSWPTPDEMKNWVSYNDSVNKITNFDAHARAHLIMGNITVNEYLIIEDIIHTTVNSKKNFSDKASQILRECLEGNI